MGAELIRKEEVYRIIGAAMAVHSELGNGFLEAVYQEAFERELEAEGVPFRAQVPLRISYKGVPLKKEYQADLICFDDILVEIKAMVGLGGNEEAQVLNYLKATGMKVGVLVNFGSVGKLEWKRFIF